jgi:hypothetical protein
VPLIALREEVPKAVNDFAREMTGTYYSFKSGLCFIVLKWDGFEKSLNCITACRDSCKRLSYFMGDRSHNRLRIQ